MVYYVNQDSNKLVVLRRNTGYYLHNSNYAKSLYLRQCMRDKIKKVKRPHVNWNDVRIELGDDRVNLEFYKLLQDHKKMSKNRLSFYALKKYYSTTALASYRWLGTPLEDFR